MKSLYYFLVLASVLSPAALRAEPETLVLERQSVRIIQTTKAVFPRALIEKGYTDGKVQIAISVDDTGKLSDWLILSYSHRLFADEALATLKQWTYEPARVRGEAVSAQLDLTIDFDYSGPAVLMTNFIGTVENANEERFRHLQVYAPCALKELDRIPVPLKIVQPLYTESMRKQGVQGVVTVHFYINEEGQVRMPTVLSADGAELASLVVEALLQWQFEPPMRKGSPVLVKAKQIFHFGPKKA